MARAGRQERSRTRWLAASCACAVLALGAGVEQVVANGWSSFLFRGPGIGASPDEQEAPQVTAAKPAPTPSAVPAPSEAPQPPPVDALPLFEPPTPPPEVAQMSWRPPAPPFRRHRPPRRHLRG